MNTHPSALRSPLTFASSRPALCGLLAATLAGCAVDPQEHELLEVVTTARGMGTFTEVTGFGNNPGALKMFKYVPQSAPQNAPLVLALHACSQTATNYRDAGWEALADRWGFYVLYPEQQPANNALRCFNWAGEYGDPENLMRGRGENQSIIQMIDRMKADHSIDPARVYITGHSGGGAQAMLMLAVWPDVFEAGAPIAGIPFHCTTTFTEVSTCLSPGINRTPQEWGNRVRAAHNHSGRYPRLSIWHGTADTTVRPMNLTEILEQWTNVHGIDLTADATSTVDGHTRREYRNASGQTMVETMEIQGMAHGTPVVPSEGCGRTGLYFLNANICAALRIGEFFGLDRSGPMPGDTTPPVVNVTAPQNGATVSGVVPIVVEATDNVAVTRVEIFVNGNRVANLSAPPWRHDWDTRTAANGSYAIRAVAHDAAGNSASDDDTRVTVQGGVDDVTPPMVQITAPTDGQVVGGAVRITAEASDDHGVSRVEFAVNGQAIGQVTAAPWVQVWDTSAVEVGEHTLTARAVDGAGNSAEATVRVTVERIAGAFSESFPLAGPEMPGWFLGEWSIAAADHTGSASSGSLYAALTADFDASRAVATVPVSIPAEASTLSYVRRAILRAGSADASAALQVVVVAGGERTVLDELATGQGEVAEADWTERRGLDLSAFAGQTVTLEWVLVVEDPSSPTSDARAWIDDIRLVSGAAGDETPPVARITSPVTGTTVEGIITIRVDATDDVGLHSVLMFANGELIGSDYRAPYEFLWDSSKVPEGEVQLIARAFDTSGNLGMSPTVTIAVRHPEPIDEEPGVTAPPGGGRWGCTASPAIEDMSALWALWAGAWILARRRGAKA